jgi:uncharacterized protein
VSAIVVFARPPIPGRTKTRLAAAIGSTAAARVAQILLENTLAAAAETGRRTILALADSTDGWRPPGGVELELQGVGGLGERMAGAFTRRFAEGHRRVVLVGSDCPAAQPDRLQEAVSALDLAAVVLGPVVDGGYWLVGQRAPGAEIFTGIPYSSPRTLAATRARLRERGVDWSELDVLADIDTWEDLEAAMTDPTVSSGLRRRLAEVVSSARR